MKKLTYILVFTALFTGAVIAQGKKIDRNLEKPDSFSFSREMGRDSKEMKKLLDESNLPGFYKKAEAFLDNLSKLEEEKEHDKAKLNDIMWAFYLVCNTPLYEIEWDSGEYLTRPWRDADDIEAKFSAILYIQRIRYSIKEISKKTGVSESDLKRGLSRYMSIIIKSLKDAYDPSWDSNEKENKYRERMNNMMVKYRDDFDSMNNALGRITAMSSRNTRIKIILNRTGELRFMELLVDFFPGKEMEVKKYLKMAGYTDAEIPDLIDRTVGRDDKTEFLYKGRKEEKVTVAQERKDKEFSANGS